MPDVSVVVSTYQRAPRLASLFRALEAQTLERSRFEVVIVDDGSRDDTPAVLAHLAASTALRVNVVTQPRNRGRAVGRNTGVTAAQSPVIAFTDDDCAPAPAWLAAGLARAAAGVADIVVGRTEPNPDQAGNTGPFSRTQKVDEASGTLYMHTCNIFYRRDDFVASGGFNEHFDAKGGEDSDLGWRLLDRGKTVVFDPDALVFHDVDKGTFRSAVREALAWRGIPRVVALHPRRARPLLVHGLFWRQTHELVLLLLASVVACGAWRNVVPLVGVLPWVYYRTKRYPVTRQGKFSRFVYLPHALIIDVLEVFTMIRGSIQSRTFVL